MGDVHIEACAERVAEFTPQPLFPSGDRWKRQFFSAHQRAAK